MKIMVTGGHVTAAIPVIEKLLQKHEVVFVGRKYALNQEKTESFEYKEISKRKIKFIDLQAGRLTRVISLQTLVGLSKIPQGFAQARKIIKGEKPNMVLSFGGYLAYPICYFAHKANTPVYTHEQTIYPGLANRLIGRFAKKVFVAFEESAKFFPRGKTVVTGNPVRDEIFRVIKKPFNIDKKKQIIYITGGSLGAHSINLHIKNIIEKLLEKFTIIHQTGETREFDDFGSLTKLRGSFSNDLKKNYFLQTHFSTDEIGYIYKISDFVVSRAGANTFFELIALSKPAIFIPLPWSAHHEQEYQAEVFQKNGCGEVFNQNSSSSSLLKLIHQFSESLSTYKNNFTHLKLSNPNNAVTTITKEIFS